MHGSLFIVHWSSPYDTLGHQITAPLSPNHVSGPTLHVETFTSEVWYGMVRCGEVWCGVVRCGTVW